MKRTSKRTSKKDKNKQQVAKHLEKKPFVLKKQLLPIGVIVSILSFFIFNFFSPEKILLIKFSIPKWVPFLIYLFLSINIFVIIGLFEKNRSKKIASLSFLVFILIHFSQSLLPVVDLSISETNNYLKLELIQSFFFVPTFVFGLISIWLYRDEINEIVSSDFKKSSHKSIPENSKTNFLSKLIIKIRQEGIVYIIGLILVTGVSATILLYQLDDFDFWSDEKQVSQGAAGYYHTGEFKQWDFVKEKVGNNYGIGSFHVWMVAQSYKIFGISEWSSRIVSVLGGILFILLGYFVLNYFFRNKAFALIILLVFSFHPDEILLFRWTRMYSILIPLFIFMFYTAYRGITETMRMPNNKTFNFIDKYLNFNYPFLIIFGALFIVGISNIHSSTTFILPVLLLFIIYLAITEKEIKYFVVLISGALIFLFIPMKGAIRVLSFFDSPHQVYFDLFNHFPLSKPLGITTILIGAFVSFIIKDKDLRKKMIYFIIAIVFSQILFSYIIMFSVSFRYISFFVPITLFFTVYVFLLLSRSLYPKPINFLLVAFLLIVSINKFSNRYENLYVSNFPSKSEPSIAYKEIVKNYKKGEAVFYQYPIHYYFKGIDTSATFINMRQNRLFKYNDFFYKHVKPELPGLKSNLEKYRSGWVVWDTQHTGHIDSLVYIYVNNNFKKIHGFGIDNTNVEVFRYTEDMIISKDSFNMTKLIPTGNLKMSNAYAFSFWLKMPQKQMGVPFIFTGDTLNRSIKLEETDKGFKINYSEKDKTANIETSNIKDNVWHHLVYYQQSGKKGDEFGLYIDGKKVSSNKIPFDRNEFVKFKANIQFRGGFDDVRIYEYILTQNQINSIYNNGKMTTEKKLTADDRYFEPIYFWKKTY